MITNENYSRRRRAGLSALEFIGCLIALIGGVWLGAIYLGVDLHHVAYVALAESDLLEKVPEQWRPVAPEHAEGAPTPAELAQRVQDELVSLREEISALRTAHESRGAAESPDAGKQASIAYWNRMYDEVRGHAALHLDAESAATEGNATKVAALKGRISRHTAAAFRALPTKDVDAALVALSKELAEWYERGGALYDQAVRIWESPARGSGSGTLTKEWEFARRQYESEGRLLGERVAAVRDSLKRRFGEGFAEFPKL